MFINLNIIRVRGDWYIRNEENENDNRATNENMILNTNHITSIRTEFYEKMGEIAISITNWEHCLKVRGTIEEIESLVERITA